MSSLSSGVSASGLCFAWPDGTPVFDGLTFSIGGTRSGLIGRNGTGKSTLFRLIAGELRPQQGAVGYAGQLGYLPQDLTLRVGSRVDEVLGIAKVRRALRAVESGDTSESTFEAIGGDWDVEERAEALLGRLGLAIGLDRRVGEISGGEAVLLGVTAELLREPNVLLLDEPTNNLDRSARARLVETISAFSGTLLVISHDVDLLEGVDQIGEMRGGGIDWYGGGFAAYQAAVAVEQDAAERDVRTAEADVRRQRRELAAAHIKLDRRMRYGQKMRDIKREPKVVMDERKRQAQVSAGKQRSMHQERLATARAGLADAQDAVRDDTQIRVDLPGTAVPAGRVVLQMENVLLRNGVHAVLELRGPERVALVGPNGAGKSTLLHTIVGDIEPLRGDLALRVPARLLPQRIDILDDRLSVAENIARFAHDSDNNARRALLARFLFRGRAADQPASTLSGGERFRAALATLLLSEPTPQLLLLDEPTNSLDLASLDQLVSALTNYRGALLVASHDQAFLQRLGITRWLELSDGRLTASVPPAETPYVKDDDRSSPPR